MCVCVCVCVCCLNIVGFFSEFLFYPTGEKSRNLISVYFYIQVWFMNAVLDTFVSLGRLLEVTEEEYEWSPTTVFKNLLWMESTPLYNVQ